MEEHADNAAEGPAAAYQILLEADEGVAALRGFVARALEDPWVAELGVLDTTRVGPGELMKRFGRHSGRLLYQEGVACFEGACVIFDRKTDRGVRRLAEALMALPHGRTTALKRLLAHTGYRRMKPREAHFALERDAAAAVELGLATTSRRGQKRYLALNVNEEQQKAEVLQVLEATIASWAGVVEEALTALTLGKLQRRFRVIDAGAYNQQRLVAAFGRGRAPAIFKLILAAMTRRGYSVVTDRPLLRLLRAWTDLSESGSLPLARLLKHGSYAGFTKPMNQARTDLAHAELWGFITTSKARGRVVLHLVDPAARVEEEAARREARQAYFNHLLGFDLTPKLRETLQLAVQAARELRPDETLHARLKRLLTAKHRAEPLTARQATVYLNEFDAYLSAKLDFNFKLTALEGLPARELNPRDHPELYPGGSQRELERLVEAYLAGCADREREFRRLVERLHRRLFASPVVQAEAPPSPSRELRRRLAGLAQARDLKKHELLFLRAVAGAWRDEPVDLTEAEAAYQEVCARFNLQPSRRSAVSKYGARLARLGYLAKSVGPPLHKHTAARRVSYYALQEDKAREPLAELEALLGEAGG